MGGLKWNARLGKSSVGHFTKFMTPLVASLGRSERRRAAGHCGEACCPRTSGIRNRYVGLPVDPKYSDQDVADIIDAVRKVYPAVVQGQPEGIS